MVYESYFPEEYRPSENEPYMKPGNGMNMGKGEDAREVYHER
jgi:hypothetical protein